MTLECRRATPEAKAVCGVRTVPFQPRDPKRQRFARVVGGFEVTRGVLNDLGLEENSQMYSFRYFLLEDFTSFSVL